MDKHLNDSVGLIAAVLASLWIRILIFMAACFGGAELAFVVRPTEHIGGAALVLFAPFMWLASPVTLGANLLTIVLLIALVRSETGTSTAGCIVGAVLLWFVHGILIWN
jgi:hypothetical protein